MSHQTPAPRVAFDRATGARSVGAHARVSRSATTWDIERTTLASVLRTVAPPLTVGLLHPCIARVGAELRELHGRGLVHGDMSPSNIVLRQRDGECFVKLVPRVAEAAGLSSSRYLAPEGATGSAADIYALGAILWWIVTGRPFRPGSKLDLQHLAPDLPEHIGALVLRMLSPQPADRPSADGFVAAWGESAEALYGSDCPLPPAPTATLPAQPEDPTPLETMQRLLTARSTDEAVAAVSAVGSLAENERHQAEQVQLARRHKLEETLQALQRRNEDVQGGAIIDRTGHLVASSISASRISDGLAGVSATLMKLGARAASELERGRVQELLVHGEDGYTCMLTVEHGVVLLVQAGANANLGLLFLDMRRAANGIHHAL